MAGHSICSLANLTEENTSSRDGRSSCARWQQERIRRAIPKSGYERDNESVDGANIADDVH